MRNLKVAISCLGFAICNFFACTSDDLVDIGNAPESIPIGIEQGIQEEAFANIDNLFKSMNISTRAVEESIEQYPDWFGGYYINEDNSLVVQTTSMATTKAVGISSNTTFELCENSYNSLLDIVLKIREKAIAKNDFLFENVAFYGIDIKENKIKVGLYKNTEDIIQRFLTEILDNENIVFVECLNKKNDSLNCASQINSIISKASVGYRAKDRNGKVGIVTAGHFVVKDEPIYIPGNTINPIGICRQSSYNDGKLDAAFCEILAASHMPTNKISFAVDEAKDTLSTKIATYFAKGSYLNMVGISSKRQSGTIENSAFDVLDKNDNTKILIKNAILVNYKADGGDSGGIVYQLTSSTNTRATAGIHAKRIQVKMTDGSTKEYSVCVKATEINKEFGLSRY